MLSRREVLAGLAAAALPGGIPVLEAARLRLGRFVADVTPPIGHPLMGGGIAPAAKVSDPLEARGIVLSGPALGDPVVLVSVDWCEIRNDAYQRWRDLLGEAAGTSPDRVLVSSVHVHDAPIADLRAEAILRENDCVGSICDVGFHEEAVRRVAEAVGLALRSAEAVTEVGFGRAQVERVASNRRYLAADGTPTFSRMSATKDIYARSQPEGLIDPWLRTISFWQDDRPLAALSHYATHPMSHYGKGSVSADFIGMARRQRQAETPEALQIYFSGCSGNVVAGKYNDGATENRSELARRMARAMREAWLTTVRQPIAEKVGFRSVPLRLEPRDDPGFRPEELKRRLLTEERPFGQCLAAMGLSWRERADAGATLDVPALDFGIAQWLLLPAESYIEFQLAAEAAGGATPVCVAGYGECAPGYIPTDRHIEEQDSNLSEWSWVARGSEARMREAIDRALS